MKPSIATNHDLGDQSLTSHLGGPCSIPGMFLRGLWWTMGHWGKFFSTNYTWIIVLSIFIHPFFRGRAVKQKNNLQLPVVFYNILLQCYKTLQHIKNSVCLYFGDHFEENWDLAQISWQKPFRQIPIWKWWERVKTIYMCTNTTVLSPWSAGIWIAIPCESSHVLRIFSANIWWWTMYPVIFMLWVILL